MTNLILLCILAAVVFLIQRFDAFVKSRAEQEDCFLTITGGQLDSEAGVAEDLREAVVSVPRQGICCGDASQREKFADVLRGLEGRRVRVLGETE